MPTVPIISAKQFFFKHITVFPIYIDVDICSPLNINLHISVSFTVFSANIFIPNRFREPKTRKKSANAHQHAN